MDQETLVIEQIEAANELIERFDRFAPIAAAFWLKTVDDRYWSLCLVSEQIKSVDLHNGYAEIVKLRGELRNRELNLSVIKLLPADGRVASDALKASRFYPTGRIIKFDVKSFGDWPVEEVYFYPVAASAPAS